MKHMPIISAGPMRESADGALRASWHPKCSCGWDGNHDYPRLSRANRAHAMHVLAVAG
jgi:hypothetical protein